MKKKTALKGVSTHCRARKYELYHDYSCAGVYVKDGVVYVKHSIYAYSKLRLEDEETKNLGEGWYDYTLKRGYEKKDLENRGGREVQELPKILKDPMNVEGLTKISEQVELSSLRRPSPKEGLITVQIDDLTMTTAYPLKAVEQMGLDNALVTIYHVDQSKNKFYYLSIEVTKGTEEITHYLVAKGDNR